MKLSRRAFTVAAASTLAAPAFLRGQNLNSKLNVAIVACGGRGGGNMNSVASENIVALCDVNAKAVEAAAAKHPNAKKFSDFRKLFDDDVQKTFDAVVVSTCEHTHVYPTLLALQHDKHVYCEKPLTHNIYEARLVREAAAAKPKLATQMGIQIHAGENYRRVVELIQANVIGPVREVHVWVSRAWGLQSEEAAKRNKDIVNVTERPKEAKTPPDYLNWDLWLGPAAQRPFHDVYFPGPKWYRWWDFGNGTMSDLGSHWNDLPFWALKLETPLTIEASGGPAHPEIAPASMSATYTYGPRADQPALKLTWHQGENKPDVLREGKIPNWGNGVLFIGDKGMLLADYGKHVLLPQEKFADVAKAVAQSVPRVKSHHGEWLEAIRNGKQPSANFQYAGLLTEANHLGNVAFRVGKKLEWDYKAMKATNAPEADRFIKREYRKGWEL